MTTWIFAMVIHSSIIKKDIIVDVFYNRASTPICKKTKIIEIFMDIVFQKLGCNGAVPLSNSLSLSDRHRINHLYKQSRDQEYGDHCPFRYGKTDVTGCGKITLDHLCLHTLVRCL